jgi:Protein of unknown function (DUF1461)
VAAVRGRILSAVVAVSTILVLVGFGIAPFWSPIWVYPAQDRAGAEAWTGWSSEVVRSVTGSILHDVILGPPDFSQVVDGRPVLTDGERGHMRDVHSVLLELAIVVAAAALVLVACWRLSGRAAFWGAVRTGGAVLGVGVAALGVMSLVAFDAVFELMHRLLFPAGTYAFAPSSRLLQLFPEQLFFESGVALGVVLIVLAVIVVVVAGPLSGRTARGSAAADAGRTAEDEASAP